MQKIQPIKKIDTSNFLENLKVFLDCIGEEIELSGQALGTTIITFCISTNKIMKAFGTLLMTLKGVYYTWVGLASLMILFGSLGG